MNPALLLALQVIAKILPGVENIAPASVANIIRLIENVLPIATSLGQELITPIKNIIAQLESTGAVTAEQVAALKAQIAQDEADLDAAAKDAGLT